MSIFSLLGKIIDDATNSLSKFDCWEDGDRIVYSCLRRGYLDSDISNIVEDADITGDCFVSFKANKDCSFEIDTVGYADTEHEVGDHIAQYVKSINLMDVYHRLCEEAVNNSMR